METLEMNAELIMMNGWEQIRGAANQLRLLTMTYVDSKGKISSRVVEPYEVKKGKLYAFCLNAQSIRAFDLLNISQPLIGIEHFEPRFPVKIS